ncbi:MAG TPA: formate dehydrogenase accessory sulfurtransferase FdhD [Stellaceae bacterium]|jgi:FdhD protein
MSKPAPAFCDIGRLVWRSPAAGECPLPAARRLVAEETPIAFAYESASYAVMMATPADLEDFAVGFTLNEGVAAAPSEISSVEPVAGRHGILLRITLAEAPAAAFWARRRYLAGPSGCGLCGLESLAEAARRPPRVAADVCVRGEEIAAAMAALPASQPMNRLTGALHAAAFWTPQDGIVAVREDVGRHNALDKLTGAAARNEWSGAEGAVLLTSRVSVEMVQKAACFGAGLLVAVSAPTALAIRAAEAAGITLIAVARRDGFETFTHPRRVLVHPPGPARTTQRARPIRLRSWRLRPASGES